MPNDLYHVLLEIKLNQLWTREDMAEKTEMREEAMDAEQSMYLEEVRGEKRASSAEDSGCVRIPPNKRKSGGSPGAGGARASDLTQELEAVLAENPLTPIGGSGSATGVWMDPDSWSNISSTLYCAVSASFVFLCFIVCLVVWQRFTQP